MRGAAVLNIIRDGETIRKVSVDGEALLGRGEGCLIRLDDRAISRQHALFKAVGDGVQVERKSDFAPLVVNGEECTRAVLKEGDVISLGPYLVRLSINRGRDEAEIRSARSREVMEDGASPSPSGSLDKAGGARAGTTPSPASPPTIPLSVPAAPPMAPQTVPMPPSPGGPAMGLAPGVSGIAPSPVPPQPSAQNFTNAPPVSNFEFEQDLDAADDAAGGPGGGLDLGPMGGLELANADGDGPGQALPGAPMDAPAFALHEPSVSQTGPYDPDAATRALPPSDLRARLVLKAGKAPKQQYDVSKAEISIGRGKDCDIVLDDKKVSRKNTVIAKSGNRFVIRDLGSANGTFVNGKAISEETLFGDDLIRVGNEEFMFQALSDAYARREKDFMAVTQGSMVASPNSGPDISLPPPIEGGGPRMVEAGSQFMPAEIEMPPDLRSPEDGHQVLYSVHPSNMIPSGSATPSGSEPHAHDGGALATMGQMQTNGAQGIPGLGDPGANPLGIPGLTGLPGGSTQPKSILAKINNLPPKRRFIAIGMILAILYLAFFDDEEAPVMQSRKKQGKTPVATASVLPETKGTPSFDSLSPEKKQFVEAQHQLAFDHYRNQEYEKALHEVQKIFDIIPDYKDSREIERYAKEGLRKTEAQEEELRRKQDEDRRKKQIEQLLTQIRDRMNKKDYSAARELFARVIELDPENQAIAQWKKDIDDWEEQLRIKEQEKHVQDEINNRAWDIFKEGMALKKAGKYHAAIATFARVPDVGASDRRVLVSSRTMIATCKAIIRARLEPVLKDAHTAEDGGEFKKALDNYLKATKIDPPHPDGWAGIARVKGILHDRCKVTYTEAVLAESYSDFEAAKKKYQEIVNNAPADDEYHGRAVRKLEKYIGLRGLAGESDPAAGGGDGGGGPPQ